jgi:hypothetical protein
VGRYAFLVAVALSAPVFIDPEVVLRDFAPIWRVRATVDFLVTVDDVPSNPGRGSWSTECRPGHPRDVQPLSEALLLLVPLRVNEGNCKS